MAEQLEVERKFLVSLETKTIEVVSLPGTVIKKIDQFYLHRITDGVERRARRSMVLTPLVMSPKYQKGEKVLISRSAEMLNRDEKEQDITEDKYWDFMSIRDKSLMVIYKDRYVIPRNNLKYELDFFREPLLLILLEVEHLPQGVNPNPPDCIKIIREVTGDERYENYQIAAGKCPGYAEQKTLT